MLRITHFHGMSVDDYTKKYKECKSKRDAERWLALKMVAMKQSIPFVASILGHDERTIRIWVKDFNENGPEGIQYKPPPGQKKNSQMTN